MANINLEQLAASANYGAQAARQALEIAKASELRQTEGLRAQAEAFRTMQGLLSRLEVRASGGDVGIQRVENIPGKRMPFDLLVDIALPSGSVTIRQGSETISQEGPFVAVSRSLSLVSYMEAVYTDPSTSASVRFQGRSYGRYRPIHSAWDLNDGQPFITAVMPGAPAFPGTGAPHYPSPSSQSSFRSMGGDFRVLFRTAGSGLPRSNISVPSTMWTRAINSPWELGALDVFERGSVLEFNLQPLHVMNPPAGNVSGFCAANAAFPFLAGQYDSVEGIVDAVDAAAGTTDPIVRTNNAIATIGFHGYRIIQTAGLGGGL